MAWVRVGAGWAGLGGGVGRMPRGKLGYLLTKGKGGIGAVFFCLSYDLLKISFRNFEQTI
jgi:hypothetical protein